MSWKRLGHAVIICSVSVLFLASCQREEWRSADGQQKSALSKNQRRPKDDGPLLHEPDPLTIKAKCQLRLSQVPLREGTADITFSVIPEEDVPLMRISFSLKGVVLVSGDVTPIGSRLFKTYTSAEANVETNISVCVRFVENSISVGAVAVGILNKTDPTQPGHEVIRPVGMKGLRYYYEPDLGRYVTWEEFTAKPWWRFDPLTGNLGELVGPAVREMNQKWIDKMRKIAPDMSVWESLYLLYDVLNTPYVPKGGQPHLSDEERAMKLLDGGWLLLFRNTAGQSLLERFPDLHLPPEYQPEKQKEFEERENAPEEDGSFPRRGRKKPDIRRVDLGSAVATQCTGTWLYRKYGYDSLYGLLDDPYDVPVRQALVAIWGYPASNPTDRRIRGRGLTDQNGYFDITVDLESGTLWRVFPVLCPIGPDEDSADLAAIKVADPTPPAPHGWPVPEDSSVFNFQGEIHWSVTPGSPQYFDTAYVDTVYPSPIQPLSGSMNIYEALLQGYNYLVLPGYATDDTMGRVVAVWEPDHQEISKYKRDTVLAEPDTIFVDGDTSSAWPDIDEWDDHVILHEYGHHVMHSAAELPPLLGENHWWWLGDTSESDTMVQTAYAEGWAHFYGAVVLDDTVLNDAQGVIGLGAGNFKNIENPWIGNQFDTTSFEGGAACEGAVAGTFWDIHDAYDESTYHSYPLLPDWPDTGLADTMNMGFDEIWHIIYTYIPPPAWGPPNRCWDIYHFTDAWRSVGYGYDHEPGLYQIITHHRIGWGFGLSPPRDAWGRPIPQKRQIRLRYSPPNSFQHIASSPPVGGYCIYRKQPGDATFSRLYTPTDTTWIDSTVEFNQTYVYTVTAFDTAGHMSDTSNNVTIWVPGSEDSLATAYNNAQKIAWAEKDSTVYVAFSSGDSVYCEISTNFGDNWLKTSVGEGAFPTIALAPDGDLWMVWLGDYGWGIDSLFLAYRSVLCAQYSAGSWSEYDTIHTYIQG